MQAVVCVGFTPCHECVLLNAEEYMHGAYWMVYDCGNQPGTRLILFNEEESDIYGCEVKAFGNPITMPPESTSISEMKYFIKICKVRLFMPTIILDRKFKGCEKIHFAHFVNRLHSVCIEMRPIFVW